MIVSITGTAYPDKKLNQVFEDIKIIISLL